MTNDEEKLDKEAHKFARNFPIPLSIYEKIESKKEMVEELIVQIYKAGVKTRSEKLEERNKFLEERWSEATALIDEFLDFDSFAQERGLFLSNNIRERAQKFLVDFGIRHPALDEFLGAMNEQDN